VAQLHAALGKIGADLVRRQPLGVQPLDPAQFALLPRDRHQLAIGVNVARLQDGQQCLTFGSLTARLGSRHTATRP
jgi:hypothetical protein